MIPNFLGHVRRRGLSGVLARKKGSIRSIIKLIYKFAYCDISNRITYIDISIAGAPGDPFVLPPELSKADVELGMLNTNIANNSSQFVFGEV